MDIFEASERGRVHIVRSLIDSGANVNIVRDKLFTPLNLALQWNHVRIIKLLLDAGAKPDMYNVQTAGLLIAGAQNNIKVMKMLIRAKANIDRENELGYTALSYSIIYNNIRMMDIVLRAGANIRLLDVERALWKRKPSLFKRLLRSRQGRNMIDEDLFLAVLDCHYYVKCNVKMTLQSSPVFARQALLIYVKNKS